MSDWKGLSKAAAVVPVLVGPHLLSADESKAQADKLARYKLIAQKPGDAKAGQVTFTTLCLSCHTVAGKGGNLAPALDGSSNRDIDGLLRALLTPNAAVEGGYRAFRVESKDGKLVEGFLVSRNKEGITLRLMGGIEQRVNMADVARADFTERSLMIEGLLDAMPEQQVADLLAFIKTLK
jgi:putative heme-binding domain-containing protein